MLRYLFLASAVFYGLAMTVSSWFWIGTMLFVIIGFTIWADENKERPTRLFRALTPLVIPGVFTVYGWGYPLAALLDHPSLKLLKEFFECKSLWLLVVLFFFTWRHASKPEGGRA